MFAVKPFTNRAHLCAQCCARQDQTRLYTASSRLALAEGSRLPRIANPSFWSMMIPRPFRRPRNEEEAASRAAAAAAGTEERRTGIAFFILGILVGSNAIQLIALRRERLNYSRQTEARLDLLREVIQRVKNGEDVDVRRALGTGNEQDEKEWEQVMEELEHTDMLWEGKKKRQAKREEKSQLRATKIGEKNHASSSPEQAASSTKTKFLM